VHWALEHGLEVAPMSKEDKINRALRRLRSAVSDAEAGEAFTELYRAYFHACCHMGRTWFPRLDRMEVEWAVNDGFFRFFKKSRSTRAWRNKPLQYLRRIIWRCLYSENRKQQTRHAAQCAVDLALSCDERFAPDPREFALSAEFYAHIRSHLSGMPPRRRHATAILLEHDFDIPAALRHWLSLPGEIRYGLKPHAAQKALESAKNHIRTAFIAYRGPIRVNQRKHSKKDRAAVENLRRSFYPKQCLPITVSTESRS
jgi:DNA-directed RNA polymerase specialized sigma24 family protein